MAWDTASGPVSQTITGLMSRRRLCPDPARALSPVSASVAQQKEEPARTRQVHGSNPCAGPIPSATPGASPGFRATRPLVFLLPQGAAFVNLGCDIVNATSHHTAGPGFTFGECEIRVTPGFLHGQNINRMSHKSTD